MKKIMLSLALVMGLGLTQINAQTTLSGGVKAEANLSNFILSDMDWANSNLGIGASLGGFLKVEFGEHFALQPELMLHFRTSEMEETGFTQDYQYFGAEIPIYAVGQMSLGSGKGYVGVGPYIGCGFDARFKMDGMDDIKLYEKNDVTDKAFMQRFDFGFGAMLGYEFDFGLQINAGYKIGIINALDAGKDDSKMLPQAISLGVGYRF